jgi:hypothetical protein
MHLSHERLIRIKTKRMKATVKFTVTWRQAGRRPKPACCEGFITSPIIWACCKIYELCLSMA